MLVNVLTEIRSQSALQVQRIENLFRVLYLELRGEPSWVTTALLREAWDACTSKREGGTQVVRPRCSPSSGMKLRFTKRCCAGPSGVIWTNRWPISAAASPKNSCRPASCRSFAFEEAPADRAALTAAEHGALH